MCNHMQMVLVVCNLEPIMVCMQLVMHYLKVLYNQVVDSILMQMLLNKQVIMVKQVIIIISLRIVCLRM